MAHDRAETQTLNRGPSPDPEAPPKPPQATTTIPALARKPASKETLYDRGRLRYSRIHHDVWVPEVLSICFSTVCFVTIFVVLVAYDGKQVPSLPHAITLNTVVAILSTASKSSLILVVGSCISQLKWSWFSRQRRLTDIQTFDDASRGPLGCAALLTTKAFLSLASVGAIVTILSLAYDPFLQQLLSYPIVQVYTNASSAVTRQARAFAIGGMDAKFVSAMNAGVWSGASSFAPTPACPSGNCTWPSFSTVGWCSKCETFDTKNVAVRGCEIPTPANLTSASQCHVELPDGNLVPIPMKAWMASDNRGDWWVQPVNVVASTLYARRATYDTYLEDPFPNSKTFLGVTSPQLAMAFVSLDPKGEYLGSDQQPLKVNTTQECVLDLCFLDYNVSVKGGVLETKVLRAQHGIQFTEEGLWCWRPPGVGEADLNWTEEYIVAYNLFDDHHMAFCLDVGDSFSFDPFDWGYLVGDLLSSNGTGQYSCAYVNNDTVCGSVPVLTGSTTSSSDIIVKLQETLSLSDLFEGIAASLTQLGRDSRPSEVTGQVALPVTYVHIRWEWLILPAVLEVAGIALLLSTMVVAKRAKTPLWKGSVLPFLYHGLEDGMREDVSALESVSSMEREAKARVRLKRAEKEGVGSEAAGRWTLGH
ncbi:hypothetical protein H2202_003877 [Exophiala xenobiotica]|nr:hypothetical protein H2202_003877 [Exophiala xenobiotica]KAK5238082.1 hypothetical protein LTR47_001175 [Exophiala xenobiotica]KAK5252037.1 hypothetical protein LTS06_003337 [Exophiala xenobiotica]KAK5355835.1 hypothetical protein LTR61_001508 [Exophiala xenobiotica]KAK5385269.1 hypothetical protein LTR11_001642 [Exophiala xenobiotica]